MQIISFNLYVFPANHLPDNEYRKVLCVQRLYINDWNYLDGNWSKFRFQPQVANASERR